MEFLTEALGKTKITPGGVSFAGRGLKLDQEEDAAEIVKAINDCKSLQSLNLEGNTLGINASKAIAKALENHKEFKQAIWKDMFTGRMKDEIPIALQHLGDGLLKAQSRLVELDLSDNAFGPIGVEGLASLLRSSCCYSLEELKLNNNGLGIGGGKLLSNALLDCYDSSKKEGKALGLRVFIAGRNRLENPGATALAAVFKKIGTLEEISMPQNGIYHVGITALSNALNSNPNLRVVNFNDNTIGRKGAASLAKVLPILQKLQVINFGDCLLKSKGAYELAEALQSGCDNLEELILDCNEIGLEAGKALVMGLENKSKLKKFSVNSNCFGEDGCEEITKMIQKMGKANTLEIEDDEGEEDEEDKTESEESQPESEEEDNEEDIRNETPVLESVSVQDFLTTPSTENLLALGTNRSELLISHAKNSAEDVYIETFLEVLLQVASVAGNIKRNETHKNLAMKCCEQICMELFSWGLKNEKISVLNNTLLVFLCLIKSEDKKFKPRWDIENCLSTFQYIVVKNYIPESTRTALECFIKRDLDKSTHKSSEVMQTFLKHLE